MSKKKNSKKKNLLVIIIPVVTVSLACLFAVGFLLFKHFFKKDDQDKLKNDVEGLETSVFDEDEEEIYEKDLIVDVEKNEYYGYDVQILSVVEVEKCEDLMSFDEAIEVLDSLGFDSANTMSSFNLDGEYIDDFDEAVIDEEKHPTFENIYITENGDYWIINILGGQIMAIPLFYNVQSERGVEIVVSEKETVTSYDNETNSFYELLPSEDELLIYVVDEINADTLSKITIEELDSL